MSRVSSRDSEPTRSDEPDNTRFGSQDNEMFVTLPDGIPPQARDQFRRLDAIYCIVFLQFNVPQRTPTFLQDLFAAEITSGCHRVLIPNKYFKKHVRSSFFQGTFRLAELSRALEVNSFMPGNSVGKPSHLEDAKGMTWT